MSYQNILVERDTAALIIRINRIEKRNSLSRGTIDRLAPLFARLILIRPCAALSSRAIRGSSQRAPI